jgi:hypothetical protein
VSWLTGRGLGRSMSAFHPLQTLVEEVICGMRMLVSAFYMTGVLLTFGNLAYGLADAASLAVVCSPRFFGSRKRAAPSSSG